MWTRVLFCLCAIAAASATNGWESGTKYTYHVRGRTLTALHQVADQYAGILTKAQLEVVAKNENQLIATLQNAQYAKVENKHLPGGWGSFIGDDQITYEPLPVSSKPTEIRHKDGVVEEVTVDISLPTWEINMIKGVISQLQMDVKGKHLIASPENQLSSDDNQNAVFKTMESSVTGRCEVQYDISALPEYVLQSRPELAPLPEIQKDGKFIDVVKSTNFSRCAKRPIYNFGFHGLQHLELGSNQMGDAIAHSSVSRAVLSGNLDKYTIQSSVTTQKTVISPNLYNTQKGMIVSRMNVTLTKTAKATEQAAGPENPHKLNDLVYILKKSPTEASLGNQDDSSEEQDDARMNSVAAKRFRVALKDQSASGEEATLSEEIKNEYKPKPQFDEPRKIPMMLGSAIEKKLVNPVRSSISIAKQIAEDLQNPSEIPEKATLSKFTILSLLARAMNTKQIQDVVHELYVPSSPSEPSRDTLLQRAAWKAWRDAVAQAGTSSALVNIKEWIVKNMVHGMEAANMIANLPSAARFPDREYMYFLFRLAENAEVKKDHSVYTSALFSFTTLLRSAHVEKSASNRYPAYVFGRLNPSDETRVDRYVDFYAHRLKKAAQKEDSVSIQTYTAVLANIAHPRVLKSFQPYLEGQRKVTSYQRMLMLASLKNMVRVSPKLVRATAHRVYQSVDENAQIRSLAAYLVMKTNPPANMIQRMAESTQFEQNEQVRSAVKSIIQSHANLKAREDWEQIANAKAAAKNLNETRNSIHFSHGLRFSKDLEDMQMTLMASLHTIGKEDSLLPASFFSSYGKSYNGIHMPASTLSVMTSSIQNLWEHLTNPDKAEPQNQQFNENDKHPLWSHNGVANLLNVQNNRSEPIEASFWLKTVGAQRFFAFDNKSIEHLSSAYRHISTQLQHGEMNFNHSRLFTSSEMIWTFPTPMGLPAIFRTANPMYYSVSGKVNAIADSQQKQSEHSFIPGLKKVVAEVQYVVSSKIKAQLMVVTPFDHKRYQAGIEKDMQINLPVRAEFERGNNEVRATIQPSNPEQKSKLLIVRSRPYLSHQDMLKLEPTQQHIIHVRKPTQTNFTVGQDYTGMAFDIDYSNERQFSDIAKTIRKFEKKEYMSAILKAITEPIQNWELIVSYNPEKSTAKSVTLSAGYEKTDSAQEKQKSQQQESEQQKSQQQESEQQKSQQQESEQLKSQQQKSAQQKKNIEQFLMEEQKKTEQDWTKALTEGQSRRQEVLKSISNKIQGSQGSAFHLIAKFNGKTEARFAAFAAVARSPVEHSSISTLYLHQNPVNQNNKHIIFVALGNKPLPPMTNYKKALEAQHTAHLDTYVTMVGKGLTQEAGKPAVIVTSTDFKQNAEQREYVLNSPMAKLCDSQMKQGNNFLPACQNVTVSANIMNEYDTRVEYSGVSNEVKNATYKAYSFARYLGWEYHTENALDVNNKENALRIQTRFAPDEQSVNITVAAPALNAKFQNVRVSPLVAAATIAHSAYTPSQMVALRLLKDQFYPSCIVDRKAINTFNNNTYTLQTEGSWHVVLHTAYQLPARQPSQNHRNVTILARKTGASEEKEFRVILGKRLHEKTNVIELTPSGKTYEVKVNNQTVKISSQSVSEFRDEHNEVFARMYATPDKSLRLSAPKQHIEVLYRPSVTVISAGHSLRDQTRGLCGTFNSEIATDFTTPNNCIVQNSEDFVASWAVMATGKDAEKQQQAKQVPCFPKTHKFDGKEDGKTTEDPSQPTTTEDPGHSSTTTEDLNQSTTTEKPDCRVKTTSIQIIKEEDQMCFSRSPQILCKPECRAVTKMEPVEFICLHKDSSNAMYWSTVIRSGANPDLQSKAANKVMNIPVVKSCEPY